MILSKSKLLTMQQTLHDTSSSWILIKKRDRASNSKNQSSDSFPSFAVAVFSFSCERGGTLLLIKTRVHPLRTHSFIAKKNFFYLEKKL